MFICYYIDYKYVQNYFYENNKLVVVSEPTNLFSGDRWQ